MLEFYNQETLKGKFQKAAWVLLIWLLWITWVSTLPVPSYITISCLPLIIIFAAVSWTFVTSATVFLLISWIYSQYSFSPPGFVWISLFLILVLVKLGSFHIIIRTSAQFFAAVFIVSLLFEYLQLTLISQILEVSYWNFKNLGGIVLSSGLQALIGAVLFLPLRRVIV